MEEPVFIKCEPGCVSGTAELNNADCIVKLPTDERTDVKIEPEEPFIKEEIEIQDMKTEPYNEGNNASEVSSNKNHTFSGRSELRLVTSVQIKTSYQCNVCEKILSSSTSLKMHNLVVHLGQRPHGCRECGKSFGSVSALRYHLLTHSKEKPFNCLHCGKSFVRKRWLDKHIITHTSGQKDHICSICGNRFKKRSTLNSHLLHHSKEKTFNCSHCGKAFAHKWSLDRHFNVHTFKPTMRRYACNACGKIFSRCKALESHFCIYK